MVSNKGSLVVNRFFVGLLDRPGVAVEGCDRAFRLIGFLVAGAPCWCCVFVCGCSVAQVDDGENPQTKNTGGKELAKDSADLVGNCCTKSTTCSCNMLQPVVINNCYLSSC